MEKTISYLARNYDDFKSEFQKYTRKYYPSMMSDFQDASVGEWFIDLVSALGDDLSYHIDRTFQETDSNSAQQRSSLLDIARTNGLKIPGRKSAMVEIEISCELPLKGNGNLRLADESYAPIVKQGTLLSTGLVTFQVMYDINFAEQFNQDGISDRQIIPKRNANGIIEKYIYKKLALALAGESKIYKQTINSNDIVPFMEILLQDTNVLNVESVIFKRGTNFKDDPPISDFMREVDDDNAITLPDGTQMWRFFEVDSLAEQYRFGDALNSSGVPESMFITMPAVNESGNSLTYNDNGVVYVSTAQVYKGEWKFLKNKFITEYTNNGQLKIIFGAGGNPNLKPTASDPYIKQQMSNMISNDFLGLLPESDTTMFVLYRVGGGAQSNIAADTLTNFVYRNVQITGNESEVDCVSKIKTVKDSLRVTNPSPSFGGKDEPTEDEIRYLIRYNNSAQERCVTLKDYYIRLMKMPARYGTPFRLGIIEENNKVVIYTLGINENRQLSKELPSVMVENIQQYLSNYRMINDFVELRSGKIINLAFEVSVFIDKTYDNSEVVKTIIDTVSDYMDINKHQMGEDIFIGDLEKTISQIDGVINLIDLRVFNQTGDGYSSDATTQQIVSDYDCPSQPEGMQGDDYSDFGNEIDLDASDGLLFSESNAMFEIKYKEKDIKVKVKTR